MRGEGCVRTEWQLQRAYGLGLCPTVYICAFDLCRVPGRRHMHRSKGRLSASQRGVGLPRLGSSGGDMSRGSVQNITDVLFCITDVLFCCLLYVLVKARAHEWSASCASC